MLKASRGAKLWRTPSLRLRFPYAQAFLTPTTVCVMNAVLAIVRDLLCKEIEESCVGTELVRSAGGSMLAFIFAYKLRAIFGPQFLPTVPSPSDATPMGISAIAVLSTRGPVSPSAIAIALFSEGDNAPSEITRFIITITRFIVQDTKQKCQIKKTRVPFQLLIRALLNPDRALFPV